MEMEQSIEKRKKKHVTKTPEEDESSMALSSSLPVVNPATPIAPPPGVKSVEEGNERQVRDNDDINDVDDAESKEGTIDYWLNLHHEACLHRNTLACTVSLLQQQQEHGAYNNNNNEDQKKKKKNAVGSAGEVLTEAAFTSTDNDLVCIVDANGCVVTDHFVPEEAKKGQRQRGEGKGRMRAEEKKQIVILQRRRNGTAFKEKRTGDSADGILIGALASLSLRDGTETTTGTKGKATKDATSPDDDREQIARRKQMDVAARFLAQLLCKEEGGLHHHHHHHDNQQEQRQQRENHEDADARTVAASSNVKSSSTSSLTSRVWDVTKSLTASVTSVTSTVITSILAGYDLSDSRDEMAVYEDTKHYMDEHYTVYDDATGADDHDDGVLRGRKKKKKTMPTADEEYDDALLVTKSSILDNKQRQRRQGEGAGTTVAVQEEDVVLSIDLVLGCCHCILQYMSNQTEKRGESVTGDATTAGGAAAAVSTQKDDSLDSISWNNKGVILLNRYGHYDDALSFQSFCREVGKALLHLDGDDDRNIAANAKHAPRDVAIHTNKEKEQRSLMYGKLLSDLKPWDVNLLVAILLSSDHATLSAEGDVLVLYTNRDAAAESKTDPERGAALQVDITLFKLHRSQRALEERTNQLSKQEERIKTLALKAKKSGNTKMALIHMKRRQCILREIDRCSDMILNLESSLLTLQRARTDVQVVKCYDTIHKAMKLIRTPEEEGGLGLSVDKVDTVMLDYMEEMEEMNVIRDAMTTGLASSSLDGVDDVDEKELEEELGLLLDEKEVEDVEEEEEEPTFGAQHGKKSGDDTEAAAAEEEEEAKVTERTDAKATGENRILVQETATNNYDGIPTFKETEGQQSDEKAEDVGTAGRKTKHSGSDERKVIMGAR